MSQRKIWGSEKLLPAVLFAQELESHSCVAPLSWNSQSGQGLSFCHSSLVFMSKMKLRHQGSRWKQIGPHNIWLLKCLQNKSLSRVNSNCFRSKSVTRPNNGWTLNSLPGTEGVDNNNKEWVNKTAISLIKGANNQSGRWKWVRTGS